MRDISDASWQKNHPLAVTGGAALLIALAAAQPARAQQASQPAPAGNLNSLVRATLSTDKPIVQAGRPVWVEFHLVNQTENRLTLRVPEVWADPTEYSEMGLPLEHVFSGAKFTGPMLEDDNGERHDSKAVVRPKDKVPAIRLAPRGSVGLRLDLTQYYNSLQRPGKYKVTWQPYNASISSEPLAITVLAERQAVIHTDKGKLTIRFYYDQAPNHVQNFIELVEHRFYDDLTINRVIPGGLIQGGDPLGNRRGVRKDGKRLKAEFNGIPFEMGTVGMCRSSADPDSASCQFFICLGRQASFDGKQTAFGYIVGDESFETLSKIAAIPTEKHQGMDDYPKRPVSIRAVSLENTPGHPRSSPGPAASSQPAFSMGPDERKPSALERTRPSGSPGTVRTGGMTVLPADIPVVGDVPNKSASPSPSAGEPRPTLDLPGTRAHYIRRSKTATRPSSGG
jgi:peptidyl-prolyl cis-trans isomerase B (cyclophilin B)